MSCSIPNMRIILCEHVMQLKIITQNKLKSPKPCFLKKHTSVLPSSCSFYLSLCVYVHTLFLLNLLQLHGLLVRGRLQ